MGLRRMLGLKRHKVTPNNGAPIHSGVEAQPWRQMPAPDEERDYWEKRQQMAYYKAVRKMCAELVPNPESVLDVGSNGCPQLEWFPEARLRTSIDIQTPYVAPGINSITEDFVTFKAPPYNLVLCLQVLEHIPDPKPFAQNLLALADHLIVSVPYRWPAGHCEWHCQDPVDGRKLFEWFGREPNESMLVDEQEGWATDRRLICYYRVHTPNLTRVA